MKQVQKWSRFSITILFTLFLVLSPATEATAQDTAPNPETVTIPGTFQSELGCAGDWMPACEETSLVYDANSDIWRGTFLVSPGNDQDAKGSRYKAAINGSWDENYGLNASRGGADVPLIVDQTLLVSFYFDYKTGWITDDFNTPIPVLSGDFQTQLGCSADNDPNCLRAWLQDPEGDGAFSFTTKALKAGNYSVTLNLLKGGATDQRTPQSFTVSEDGDETYFGYDTVKDELNISTAGAPKGSLTKAKAVWVNQDTLLWNIAGSPKYDYTIVYSPTAKLKLTADGISGGREIPLVYSVAGPGGDVFKLNPYLAGYSAFKIEKKYLHKIPAALRSQLAVIARDEQGKVVDSTGIQIAGVLDSLYAYSGPLGIEFKGEVPTFRVWAPTANKVRLVVFETHTTPTSKTHAMKRDNKTGVWSATGKADWNSSYYLYEVEVFVPATGKIETNLVTDPYSLGLSTNSLRSQVINLADDSTKPSGWDELIKPVLAAPEDAVIYELHIRDFSIQDQSVPEALRGTFKAFTVKESDGMQHLFELAETGLTHIHLLPAFDIASVNEDKSTWKSVNEQEMKAYPPDSDQQALAVSKIKGEDGFNWGYDPYHYTVPEGSYATDPEGMTRIIEFREMVKALNETGLRVVMDVVYNHTSESGQNPRSVLDKIVPGYYYRLDAEGKVTTSTCCQNTATEHKMMEKLMVDSVVTWAREYKVDGFRFDLMGHHMLTNMQAVRSALDALTLEQDGVDGKSIYIYGEGWDFGEVAKNARGTNATQLNIGGTGIGVFNDRLRDAARGGNPFGDPREQGFSTGLLLTPNAAETRSSAAQKDKLFDYMDWIRIGLAGNLRDFQFVKSSGEKVNGAKVFYNGAPAGYTLDPQENIIYVSAHDNETIFDAVQLKVPADATLAERIRMNNLALSIPMLSQGIPFFHAGDDLLRSKSLDRNSYDSGDWYNQLDWTGETNNWGIGLPIEGSDKWTLFKPLLADAALKPAQVDIAFASAVFREFLSIRKGSPLFRLTSAELVSRVVNFNNTGPDQVPGLIVMRLSDTDNLDQDYREMIVFFNAGKEAVGYRIAGTASENYLLHPVQKQSVDATVRQAVFNGSSGLFTIPGYTTAVFVLPEGN